MKTVNLTYREWLVGVVIQADLITPRWKLPRPGPGQGVYYAPHKAYAEDVVLVVDAIIEQLNKKTKHR